MNQRIEELETEAYKHVNSVIHPNDYTTEEQYSWFHRKAFNEKFAELIIKECASICDKIYFERYPDAEDFERSEEGDTIKEHFGVE